MKYYKTIFSNKVIKLSKDIKWRERVAIIRRCLDRDTIMLEDIKEVSIEDYINSLEKELNLCNRNIEYYKRKILDLERVLDKYEPKDIPF